jgi:hypothetical protein
MSNLSETLVSCFLHDIVNNGLKSGASLHDVLNMMSGD